MHAPEQRAGPAVAHRPAVERGHRQDAARRERQPYLLGGAQLGFADRTLGCRSRARCELARPRRASCRAESDAPFGGVRISPLAMTCTVVEDPSVSSPRSSMMVSNAPASTASFLSRTFASSAVDLMSRRAQRVSAAVTAATPSLEHLRGRASSAVGIGEYRRLRAPPATRDCGRTPRRGSPADKGIGRRRRCAPPARGTARSTRHATTGAPCGCPRGCARAGRGARAA